MLDMISKVESTAVIPVVCGGLTAYVYMALCDVSFYDLVRLAEKYGFSSKFLSP